MNLQCGKRWYRAWVLMVAVCLALVPGLLYAFILASDLNGNRTAAGGPMRIFVYDALGNMVALTDTGGNLTNVNAYKAFGSIILSSGTSINNGLAHTKEG